MIRQLILAMVIYFAVAGFLGYEQKTLDTVIQSAVMRIRLNFLAHMSSKIQKMDYPYVEDAVIAYKGEM